MNVNLLEWAKIKIRFKNLEVHSFEWYATVVAVKKKTVIKMTRTQCSIAMQRLVIILSIKVIWDFNVLIHDGVQIVLFTSTSL